MKHQLGKPVGTGCGVEVYETLILFTLGIDKHEAIQKFVEEVIAWDEASSEFTFHIYKYSARNCYWSCLGEKIARPMESVVLPTQVKEYLLQDLREFLSPETFKWYKQHGIPYKRNYLLYGPPGSGKSSIIQAIAGYHKLNLCYIQPIDPSFTDTTFTEALQSAPSNALIVLEDIDTYFAKDRTALHPNCPLTFSGLLNGLDGVAAADGQVFILTTNFIDRLDSALIRQGRVDAKFEFPNVNPELARLLFLQFYPGNEIHAESFKTALASILSEKKLCMADLQQYFIANRKSSGEKASEHENVKKLITGEQLQFINEHIQEQEEKLKKEKEEHQKTSENGSLDTKHKHKHKNGKQHTDDIFDYFGKDAMRFISLAAVVATGLAVLKSAK